jgi:hypothetical protein
MLNEARGPVTWWKDQNDFIFFIFLNKTKVIFPVGYPTASKITKPA